MTSLQVRELPEHIYQRLKQEAKAEHRSIAQQAVVTLARGLGLEENPRQKRGKILDSVRTHAITDRKLPDPVKLIRQDRKR